mmetsp:Transcript_24678/g.30320  ORF Transcript_24678/g.30320 Transcript_24678/m.30320 type:complete len:223 (+) Transcript_24678:39-707(+)
MGAVKTHNAVASVGMGIVKILFLSIICTTPEVHGFTGSECSYSLNERRVERALCKERSSLLPLSPDVIFIQKKTALFGWGKRKKEYLDEEFCNDDLGGNRRGFDAYELQEKGDFYARVAADRMTLKKRSEEDYLEIARMAGVTDQRGDGVEPMGNFDSFIEGDEDSAFLDDDEYDLDVRVDLERDVPVNVPDSDFIGGEYDPDVSITRYDDSQDVAGASGKW